MFTSRASRLILAGFGALVVTGLGVAASAQAERAAASTQVDHPMQLTFTKWVTINPGGGIMQGIVAGDAVGKFAGQVLVNDPADLAEKLGAPATDITLLEAVYEVQAGDHSLRALVHGGYDAASNQARLEGTVLGGWLTGDRALVRFEALPCSQSHAGNQPNAAGGTCYQGTITIVPNVDS